MQSYIVAGLLFGIVPISLSVLGFLGANKALGVSLPPGTDPSMIGVAVVTHFLPSWAVVAFVLMLLGGLCSTLDSGLCAASSLFAMNCFKFTDAERRLREKERLGEELTSEDEEVRKEFDRKVVKRGRYAMYGITMAGLLVAFAVLYIPGFGLKYLWWVFNTVAACVAVPTILSLYWSRLSSQGVFWGVLTAFVIGVPVFVYANVKEIVWLSVAASVGIILTTVFFALIFPRKEPFNYQGLTEARAESGRLESGRLAHD